MAEAGYPVTKGLIWPLLAICPRRRVSSSASLEILLLNMLKDMMGLSIDKLTIVKLGR